ncbi:MAG: hypothetical protein AB7O64_17785 [Methylibium sp.]
MRRLCYRCWLDGDRVPSLSAQHDLCDSCHSRAGEEADEQALASYYAGGGLWAERARTDEARRVK